MTYQVSLSKRAIKKLETISEPYYSSIKQAIYGLADDPRPHGYKKLKGREGYRIKVSDYRIIYEIFDNKLVVDVIDLGHRRNIYE
jgi:mRNA interferase RelE/StbE